MQRLRTRTSLVLTAATGVVVAAGVWAIESRTRLMLGDPAILSGWTLVAVIVFLSAFNTRKRLAMLPLGRVAHWLRLHLAIGVASLVVFVVHIEGLWPRSGLYEQVLAGLFYGTCATGILGWIMQRGLPRRLTQTGAEVIYERIPVLLAGLRHDAESIVADYARTTGTDTLSRHYTETLHWFFRRPRFTFSHIVGGQQGAFWVENQNALIARHLDATERPFLERLHHVMEQKTKLDIHYALQGVMKRWLLVHLPLSVAMLVLTGWHVLLVHVYRP